MAKESGIEITGNDSLSTIDISSLETCGSISITNNESLTSIVFGYTCSCLSINLGTNALSQDSVDDILLKIDSAGYSDGTLDLSGGTNAVWSVTGFSHKVSLQEKGWEVTDND